ncbi:hypothetical protein Avbf_02109 [Armadillidium vulgare]|nr:hypothetical protein Avbf_02109 [Armadillidium vulgare]
MYSRWEMHCDSLIEEPHGSSTEPVLHEPPRRLFLKDLNEFRKPETVSTFREEECFEDNISVVKRSNAFQFFFGGIAALLAMLIAYYSLQAKR